MAETAGLEPVTSCKKALPNTSNPVMADALTGLLLLSSPSHPKYIICGNNRRNHVIQLISSWSANEIENRRTVVNSLQRQFEAMPMAGAVQRGTTQAAYQLADDIRNSGAASIAMAGISDAVIEKAFDGLKGYYGKSFTEKQSDAIDPCIYRKM